MATFDMRNTTRLESDKEELVNAILRRETDALSSFYNVDEIINRNDELVEHLVRPGIVEKVLDFLSNGDILNDNYSKEIVRMLVYQICRAPSQSDCFDLDFTTIERSVAVIEQVPSDVCMVILHLLAKLTQNPNVQMFAGRAGIVDMLAPLLSVDSLPSARDLVLEILTNIAQNPLNAIWFRACYDLLKKLPALLRDPSESVQYQTVQLMVSITSRINEIDQTAAIVIADILRTALLNTQRDALVHEQLASAVSHLQTVPEYRSLF